MSTASLSDDQLAEAVIELCEEIENEHTDNDDALEFAESVKVKAESMLDGIRRYDKATEAMRTALENMHEGASKWLNTA